MAAAEPARAGLTMAFYSFIGFAGSFLGPTGIQPQMHVTVGVREAGGTASLTKGDGSRPK